MKKLIVFAVVFALIAGTAFADTSVGGALEFGYVAASGNTEGDGTSTTSFTLREAYLQIAYTSDDGVISGLFRPKFHEDYTIDSVNRGFIWWNPLPQLRLFFGKDGDGLFNTAQLTRWGHHRSHRGTAIEDWDAGYYFLGNWDAWGLAAVIKPIDILTINLSWDLDGANNSEDWIKGVQAQAHLGLDFGNIFITYMNGEHSNWWRGGNSSVIGLTFNSYSLVEGLALEVGANYWLEEDGNSVTGGKGDGFITAGLGVHYSAGDFGLRTRFFIEPSRSDKFWIKADIMPFYGFEFGRIFCNIRVETVGDNIGWHVNPYFVKNIASFEFRAGIIARLDSGDFDDGLTWSVPFGMVLSF